MTTNAPRPRILVAVDEAVVDGRWGDYAADYRRAVEAAGGEAIPLFFHDYAPHSVPPHDGLVTIGGIDVDPAQYGEPPHPRLGRTDSARDTAELALTRLALNEGRPLLAICRGAQVMNVACGGTLHQHIEAREAHHGPRGTDESGWHDVEVAPESLLARISGQRSLRVNSRHHQAITPERLAPGLVESGRTEHGGLVVLEAFEVVGHSFALGVQWHPERPEMFADPVFEAASPRLFEAFIAACTETR